jgi:hypothetical protein
MSAITHATQQDRTASAKVLMPVRQLVLRL